MWSWQIRQVIRSFHKLANCYFMLMRDLQLFSSWIIYGWTQKFSREGMRKSDCRADQTRAHVPRHTNTQLSFSSYCFVQFVTWYLSGRRWQVLSVECTMQPGVELFWKERWYWHRKQTPQTPVRVHFLHKADFFYPKGAEQRDLAKEKMWGKLGDMKGKVTKCKASKITGQRSWRHYENELTVKDPWRTGELGGVSLKGLIWRRRGGVGGAGRAVSQKTRAKQICDLELGEQPLRRD